VLGITAVLAFAVFVFDLLDKQKQTEKGKSSTTAWSSHVRRVRTLTAALPFLGFRIDVAVCGGRTALLDFRIPKELGEWRRFRS
jgi:hypothetical protein